MDIQQLSSGTRGIGDLARSCETLFRKSLSTPQLATARSRLEETRQYFGAWISYLGVLAVGNASLEYRLRLSDEIRVMVVDLLLLLERNLTRLFSSKLEDPSAPLDSLRGGVDRLNRMAIAIRKSSIASLASRIKSFSDAHDDEDYFYSLAFEILRKKLPNANDGLWNHLATSIKFRRQSLLYKRRHQDKLKPQPEHHEVPTLQSSSARVPLFKRSISPPLSQPAPSPAPSQTTASTFVPGAFLRHYSAPDFTHELEKAPSVPSVISLGTTVGEDNDLPYPKPPEGEQVCDWCFQIHSVKLYQNDWWWRHHILEALEPYICLSESCKDPPKLFNKFSEWRNHMRSVHGVRWPQEVYKPIQWCCDIGHDTVYFDKETLLESHLIEKHPGTFKSDQIPTVIEQNSISLSREPHVCPLCDSVPDGVKHILAGKDIVQGQNVATDIKLPSKSTRRPRSKKRKVALKFEASDLSDGMGSPSATVAPRRPDLPHRDLLCLKELERHIAGHLKSAAFVSIRNFDDKSSDGESKSHFADTEIGNSASTVIGLEEPSDYIRIREYLTNRTSHGIGKLSGRVMDLEDPPMASEHDRRRYGYSQVSLSPHFVGNDLNLQKEVNNRIASAADVMTLPTRRIQFEPLFDQVTLEAVDKCSAKTVDETYDSAMKCIERRGAKQDKLTKQILLWIGCAKRPLTTTELQHALAVEVGKSEFDESNLPQIEDMIASCAGLVKVDNESKTMRMLHSSAQDYFERKQNLWFPNAGAYVTRVCITYLSFNAFETGVCKTKKKLEERLRSFPFYRYAARNWGYQAAKDEASQDVIRFLESKAKVDASSQVLIDGMKSSNNQIIPNNITGLHLAAFFGLEKAANILLELGHSPNAADIWKREPLWFASCNGHEAIVKLLLTAGADVKAVSGFDMTTARQAAAKRGHYEIVKLLAAKEAQQ
ncbi:hypothetical protein V8C35DRAFT_302164 [Trichoderma chlorosporum]